MNENQPSIDDDTTSDPEDLVTVALRSIDIRLRQLEKPEEKSRLVKFQQHASFLALIVGIVLSVISLFDIFWSKPPTGPSPGLTTT